MVPASPEKNPSPLVWASCTASVGGQTPETTGAGCAPAAQWKLGLQHYTREDSLRARAERQATSPETDPAIRLWAQKLLLVVSGDDRRRHTDLRFSTGNF
jgi:hypothetical protein